MKRRQFIQLAGLGSLGLVAPRCSRPYMGRRRRVAITIDDPATTETPLMSVAERDARMLTALGGLQAALFVCGKRVDSPAGRELLDRWEGNGHLLCNHSYSHLHFHKPEIDVTTFTNDLTAGENVIVERTGFRRIFRFPFLKEGNTVAKRNGMREFLRKHGYRNGHVTIDTSDWYFDSRLQERLLRDPAANLAPYRAAYLEHVQGRARFYDDLATRVLGRALPHTILLHHTLLNALFLGDLLAMFEAEGWELVDAAEAFDDPVFAEQPDILPAGESLIWALAKQAGTFDALLRYPGESGEYEKEMLDARGL